MHGKETPRNRSEITCLQVARHWNDFYQLLLHQVKETSGTCQYSPVSLDIYSRHTSILMPREREINSKGSHLSPNSTLKILKQPYLCAQYFWQSQALSQSRADECRTQLAFKCPLGGRVRLHEAVWLCGGRGVPPRGEHPLLPELPKPRFLTCMFSAVSVPRSLTTCNNEITASNHVQIKNSMLESPRSGQVQKGISWHARADWDESCTGGWRRAQCASRGWAPPRRPAPLWPSTVSRVPCPCRSPCDSTPETGR